MRLPRPDESGLAMTPHQSYGKSLIRAGQAARIEYRLSAVASAKAEASSIE
ncbi:MAG: hypothetical protein ACYS19_13950 [Planctomycetota bacterium]